MVAVKLWQAAPEDKRLQARVLQAKAYDIPAATMRLAATSSPAKQYLLCLALMQQALALAAAGNPALLFSGPFNP
jgi:hypothetical protein